jgi:hypothetical protein
MSARTIVVLLELFDERQRQTAKHGDQSNLPDGTGPFAYLEGLGDVRRTEGDLRMDRVAEWAKARTEAASHSAGDGTITFEHILTEEWGEAIAESDPNLLRAELIQVAAVAVQWIEAIDARGVKP